MVGRYDACPQLARCASERIELAAAHSAAWSGRWPRCVGARTTSCAIRANGFSLLLHQLIERLRRRTQRAAVPAHDAEGTLNGRFDEWNGDQQRVVAARHRELRYGRDAKARFDETE